jgi:hypothetical protein
MIKNFKLIVEMIGDISKDTKLKDVPFGRWIQEYFDPDSIVYGGDNFHGIETIGDIIKMPPSERYSLLCRKQFVGYKTALEAMDLLYYIEKVLND